MGYHKRHITNKQVKDLYLKGGSQMVIDRYTTGVESVSTEPGLSLIISNMINDSEDTLLTEVDLNKAINDRIRLELGI